MNDDLLKGIWTANGYDKKGPYEKFKADMLSNPELRLGVFTSAGYDKKGPYDKFEKDIGVVTQQGIPELPIHQKGPVGVARPGVMANPGMDNGKLSGFYKNKPGEFGGSAGVGAAPPPESYAKAADINSETKAAELINKQGNVLDNARSIYTNIGNKEAKYSKDPQIANAEFSFEALAHYKENAQLVSKRSRERLGLLYSDKYTKPEIENAINTYAALSLMGRIEEATAYIKKYPELASDPNLNNIFTANQRMREVEVAKSHVIKNNPKWLERQQKIEVKGKEIDENVEEYRDSALGKSGKFLAPTALAGVNLLQPNVGQAIKSRIGTWAKNLAVGPGMRDWGRDMMDFNPVSSDYKGGVIEHIKSVDGRDLVYEGDKLAYIRDSETGMMVDPTDKEKKELQDKVKNIQPRTRINPKPIVAETANVVLDMAPIVAITYATGGLGSAAGLSLNAGRNLGVILGSGLQMRGDIMDQMLLHPDITPLEAELYTLGIGWGIGAISLANPIEKRLLQGSIPGILRSNSDKLLSQQITKGQLAWNVVKDIGVALGGEPVEEIGQDWFQHIATGIVDKKEGYGRFNNPAPTGESMLETALVTAAAGFLGGAGSIRTQRTQFIDDALDHALSKPKIMEEYFAGLEEGVSTIEDEDKKEQELDRITRLKQRWTDLKANTDSVKGLKGAKRGQLAALLLDSNALEEEAKGITNKDLLRIKNEEIKDVNQQITDLIAGKVPVSTVVPPPIVDDEAVDNNERDYVEGDDLMHDPGADVNIDYFDHGQRIEDENGAGVITDVHKNKTDGTTHSVEIKYDDGETKTIIVAKKTPQEVGIKVLGEKVVKAKPTPEAEIIAPITTPVTNKEFKEYQAKNPDGIDLNIVAKDLLGEIPNGTPIEFFAEKARAGTWDANRRMIVDKKGNPWGVTAILMDPDGYIKTGEIIAPQTDTEPSTKSAAEDPHVQAEIDREHVRLIRKRDAELAAVDQLLTIDPEYPVDTEKAKIEARYEQGLKDATFVAKKALIQRTRIKDVAHVKAVGKSGVNVAGTIDRINKKADAAIAELEKQYKPKKNENNARKDTAAGQGDGTKGVAPGPESAKEGPKPTKRKRRAKSAFERAKAVSQRTKEALKLEVGNNPVAMAMQYLLDKQISRDVITELLGIKMKYDKNGRPRKLSEEISAKGDLLSKDLKGNISDLGDEIWGYFGSPDNISGQDFANAVSDILLTYNTRAEIAEALIEQFDVGEDAEIKWLIQQGGVDGDYLLSLIGLNFLDALSDEDIQRLADDEYDFENSPEYQKMFLGEDVEEEEEPLTESDIRDRKITIFENRNAETKDLYQELVEPKFKARTQALEKQLDNPPDQPRNSSGDAIDRSTWIKIISGEIRSIENQLKENGFEKSYDPSRDYQKEADAIQSKIDVINAKYDAELATLYPQLGANNDTPPLRGTETSDDRKGENLSTFKKGDIVYRNFDGRYEEYEIMDDRKWTLRNTSNDTISEWNANGNGGFFLLPADIIANQKANPKEDAKLKETQGMGPEVEEAPESEPEPKPEPAPTPKPEPAPKENVGPGMSLSNFEEGDTVWRKLDGRYQEFEIMKANGEKPWILKSPSGQMHRVDPYSEGFNIKTKDTDTFNTTFQVDDDVIFTNLNGEESEANFRGYNGKDKAVIVINGGNQIQVDVSQIRAKPPAEPPAPAVTPKEHKSTITTKFTKVFISKGVPKDQVEAGLALMEARANSWASEKTGRDPDEWYGRIADVKMGEIVPETTLGTVADIFGKVEKTKKLLTKSEDLQDVGEKIGGAKKDLARHLRDLEGITDDALESQPLRKVFPEPNYKKLVDDGLITQEGAILLRFIYDNIPPKPRKASRIPRWVETVQSGIEYTKNVLEAESTKDLDFTKKIVEGLIFSATLKDQYQVFSATMKALDFPTNPAKLGEYKIEKFASKWEKNAEGTYGDVFGPFYKVMFGYNTIDTYDSIDKAIARLKESLDKKAVKGQKSKDTKFEIWQDHSTNLYFIGKQGASGVVRVMEGFAKISEAREFLRDKQAELQAIWDGMKADPEERRSTNRARVGEDWRKGKDVTAEDFSKQFGFRGVEFGNWVNIAERQMNVNQAYDALMDLSSALGISPKSLSLNGELGFAFGARGSGRASAHYEPGKVVINLTKTKGAGSLAHEWWHAMDNYFSRMRGVKTDFLTNNPRSTGGSTNIRNEMLLAFQDVMAGIRKTKLTGRSKELDATRSQPYWSTPIEMSARSFESYIVNKLAETQHNNDYLANFKETGEWVSNRGMAIDALKNYPYPLVDEADIINAAYKNFFDAINEDDNAILYQDNKGAVEVLADGRKVIVALNSPDFSTIAHELAHVFEGDLTQEERTVMEDFGGREPFARAFERYLRDGDAPTPELQSLFEKFKQWLSNIYKTLVGTPIEKNLTPEIRGIFDRLLTEVEQKEEEIVISPTPPVAPPTPKPPVNPNVAKRKVRDEKLDEELDDDLALLKKQIKNPNKLTVGGIDPDALATAGRIVGKYIKKGVYKFSDIIEDLYAKVGDDLEDLFAAIKNAYGGYFNQQATDEEAAEMDQNLRSFTYESLTSKFKEDVSDRPTDSTGDSQNGADRTEGDTGDLSGEDGGTGRDTGDETQGSDNTEDGGRPGGESTGGLRTPPLGEQTDLFLHPEVTEAEFEEDSTGSTDGRGNSTAGPKGSDANNKSDKTLSPGTESTSDNFQEQTRLRSIEQGKAEPIPAVLMDEDNIRETLPYLLAPQQDDVIKAEKRFFSPEHDTDALAHGKGMMFTNGTGSGKTFTALGIAKRFVKMGKGQNILIVTPSAAKVSDWSIKEAPYMRLKVVPLEGITDGGKGINVTTFANFRTNKELLKRDFDLIIYDESHRIMEAQGGKESSTTDLHRMMGNKDAFWALRRLHEVHPLWIKERRLVAKLQETDKRPTSAQWTWLDKERDIRQIQSELVDLREEQKLADVGLKKRAAEAVDKTKVVFLSATPFKEQKNLEYGNGFLFDYGDKETASGSGWRKIPAKAMFYLTNFGSAWEWSNNRLTEKKGKDADAVSKQEVDFSEKLRTEGVLSGYPIDSEKDYSREFPLVAGFNSEAFNKAFNDIFNYDNGQFTMLSDAARKIFYNYIYTTPLFEALKTSAYIDRIKKHQALGRKVVIFHRRREAEVSPPFRSVLDNALLQAETELAEAGSFNKEIAQKKYNKTVQEIAEFEEKYASLLTYEQTLDYRPVTEQIEDAFPGQVGYINGDSKHKSKKVGYIKDFNTDGSKMKILVVQEEAGKEGISLHDTTGTHQRVLITMSMPISTTTALQAEGRIYRLGQASNAILEYPILGIDLEIAHFGQKLNRKLSTTENLAMGEQSRDLIRSFAEGVLFNSSADDPHADQGQGGKEYDRRLASELSEFRKSVMVYNSNQKLKGKRNQREGVDFYPTPEPVGQKMVEWAHLRAGDHALEPSAGNGAIAMWFPVNGTTTSIEPSFDLFAKLNNRAVGGKRNVYNQKFEDLNIVNKYDAITMNPPFGHAGATAMQHVEKAFGHLREGGRIVALIPTGQMDARMEKFLYGTDEKGKLLHPGAHLVREILLPSITFQQVGTAINTRIVIIDKVNPRDNTQPSLGAIDLTSAKTVSELFERIEHLEMPDRAPKLDPYGNPIQETSKPTSTTYVDKVGSVAEYTHTITGENLFAVKPAMFYDRDEYVRINNIAKKHEGSYSTYAKRFLFKTREIAEAFRAEVNGKPVDGPQFSMDAPAIPLSSSSDVNIFIQDQKIDGKLLTSVEAETLQKKIESTYLKQGEIGLEKGSNDIRQAAWNYDSPYAKKEVNGVDVRIVTGLVKDLGTPQAKKSYLLYADGKIVGEFGSVADAKATVDFIEKNLIKGLQAPQFSLDVDNTAKALFDVSISNPEQFGDLARLTDEYPDEEQVDFSVTDNAEAVARQIAEAYHQAKIEDGNPGLVDAVESVVSGTSPLARFSLDAANTAIASGNPNPNAKIIIHLRDAHATLEERIPVYASVWLDGIKKQSLAFYNRGLQLIKGTAYDTGNGHEDLAKAIADKAFKAPKNPTLISWVKQFWTRVNKMLKLNITPEQLQELTVEEYLNIASTTLKFGNDIFNQLIQDGATVSDIPTAEGPAKIKSVEEMFDEIEDAPPEPTVSAAPSISADKKTQFESRDLTATGTFFANPKGPGTERMLREYAGAQRRVIETLVLLFPTLKKAGITTVLHETVDSYANAVIGLGGTPEQAMGSSGVYRNSQIHINLAKRDLKANVALHEVFHPIIREILVKDRPTFQRFINDILADSEMKRIYADQFASAYTHLNTDGINEEILVEASADTVLRRMMSIMDKAPDKLWDRVLQYIKKALGETYGAMMQFIDTRQGFSAWANFMADALSKGMVVPINPEMHDNIRTVVQESKERAGNLFGGSAQTDLFGLMNNAEPTLKQEKATPEALLNQKYFDLGYPAPNGKKSNLTPKQYAQVRTPEFKAWFGDWEGDPANASKVVDENGEPLVVYHGTNADFEVFKQKNKTLFTIGNAAYGAGNYFTSDRQEAETFGQNTKAVFLDLRNPTNTTDAQFNRTSFLGGVSKNKVQKAGYDGIMSENLRNPKMMRPPADVFVTYEPTQIKSATDNSGAFSSDNPNINFSLDSDRETRKRQILSDLTIQMMNNPSANWEAIVGKLKDKGWFNKHEVDDILRAWRNGKDLNLNEDQKNELLWHSAELNRLHRMDDYDNRKMNQAAMEEFTAGHESGEETFLEKMPKYKVQELIEDVTASGDAHPKNAIETFEELNGRKTRGGADNPAGASPRDVVAASIAMSELRKSIRSNKQVYDQTGEIAAYDMIVAAEKQLSKLIRAVYLNSSFRGASLGINSKLLKLAGLTYESELAHLEAINQAGKKIAIDPKDKETIKRLVDEINDLKDQQDKLVMAMNPKKDKAAAAEKEYTRKMGSSLESRPTITKAEAIELLKRRRAANASFSLSFSLDAPELSYEDIINELVKLIHLELTEENRVIRAKDPTAPLLGGFKTVVSRIQAIDSTIAEDDIYKAILSTTPRAKDNALSEYAKMQALTRKHVKDINKVEDMLRKYAGELLRKNSQPTESQMAEFGKLLKEIEKNIYNLDLTTDLYTKWLNALQAIRDGYQIAFLNPVPTKDTEILLGKILNSAGILKDAKFYKYLEAKNAKVQAEIDLINAGRVSELIDQEDKSYRKYPDERLELVYNDDGSVKMESVPDLDENGIQKIGPGGEKMTKMVPMTKPVTYNYGQIERMIQDKQREVDLAKEKYRKVSGWDKFKKGVLIAKSTFGSSVAIGDVSVILNQGFKAALTGGLMEPGVISDAFGKSMRAGFDEFRKNPGLANQFEKEIHDAEYYHISQRRGLILTNLGQHLFVNEMIGAEDAYDLLLDKTKGRKNIAAKTARVALTGRKKIKDASNAQFATYLNVIAYNKFHNYYQKVLKATGSPPSDRELEALSAMINAALGRTGRLEGFVGGAQYFFWAPRLYLSHIINVVNIVRDPAEFAYHMAKGNGDLARIYRHRTINSMIFAANVALLHFLTAELAKWICGEASVQMNPAKPSFLKVNCGELTLDPVSAVRQWGALGHRLFASWSGDPYTDFVGNSVKTVQQLYNHFKYKFNPLASTTIDVLDASDFMARDRIPGDESFGKWRSRGLALLDHLTPIAPSAVVDIGKAKDVATPAKPFLMVEALLGSPISYINAEKEAEREKIEGAIKTKEKSKAVTDAIGTAKKRLGAIEELNGKFAPTTLPIETLVLTKDRATYGKESYRVFKITDDDDDPDNDFVTIKTHKTGAQKGLKYLDRIDDPKKIH